MIYRYTVLFALLLAHPVMAQTTAMELKHANGDVLSIQRLQNGEVWGSLFLSDQMTASFASNELIVLQVDEHKPIKLEQGYRSCGAPAPKPQQVVYQFEQSEPANWSLTGGVQSKPDVLKLLGWDNDQFIKLEADRRLEVVDFPLDSGTFITQQLIRPTQITFRYVTTLGEQRQTVFHLAPHQHVLEQLIPH